MQYADDKQILIMISSSEKREEGFKHLVGKYKEKLYWHIRRMVDDHEDADDVLQNTFVKVVKSIDRFQQQSALYTWLYRIATNEALNLIQSRKNKGTESVDLLVNVAGVMTDFDENSALFHLKNAIGSLPDKQKIVFNLRYYDEMSYQEISDVTGTSVGALKASYHHAVKKIEEHLKATI